MDQAATAPCPTSREAYAGRRLLWLAALVLLVASLRDITGPWEQGMRGAAAAAYTDGAVAHTLAYGLGVTLGMPALIVERDDGYERMVNWHHPPAYWLYLSLAAWSFGHEPVTLRAAQLLLFLPGLLALYALVRRRYGELPAGIAAVLFATCPLVAYFGPMALQDGAVLGLGLVTMWCFQRHLDAPGARSWLWTAAAFFAATSLDYTGYWWGLAMFVLALGTEPRLRNVGRVMSFVPVSLLSFAVMAVHYGVELGGPLGFVRELLHVTGADHADARATATWSRFGGAMRELWIDYGNAPFGGLALAGVVLAFAGGTGPARRLAWLGAALVVPGVVNYGAMMVHALDHVFWSLQGFAGLCVLGAIVPLTGRSWLGRPAPAMRAAGALLVAGAAATAAFGAWHTHTLITRYTWVDNGTPALMAKALPELAGCTWALTSAERCPQQFFGATQTWPEIDTPEKLQFVLQAGRDGGLRGRVAFVLHPRHRDSPLRAALDRLGTPVDVDGVLVYRLTL